MLGAAKGKDYKVPVYKLDIDIGRGVSEANAFAKGIGIKPKSVGLAANRWVEVANAFCPGEGARDNSCGSSGGSGRWQGKLRPYALPRKEIMDVIEHPTEGGDSDAYWYPHEDAKDGGVHYANPLNPAMKPGATLEDARVSALADRIVNAEIDEYDRIPGEVRTVKVSDLVSPQPAISEDGAVKTAAPSSTWPEVVAMPGGKWAVRDGNHRLVKAALSGAETVKVQEFVDPPGVRTTNEFNPDQARDEQGRWTASGGFGGSGHEEGHGEEHGHGEHEHKPHESLEHAHHDVHTGHEAYELLHGMSSAHGLHGHLEVPVHLDSSHVVELIRHIPGAGPAVVALHDRASRFAEDKIKQLQERYGKHTMAGILGSGALLAAAARHALHLGPLGKLIPGQNLVAAIPLVVLAEAGKRLGYVHDASHIERVSSKAAHIVHAVRSALGKPIGAIESTARSGERLAAEGGLKAAGLAGKATRTAGDWLSAAWKRSGEEQVKLRANEWFEVNEAVDVDRLAEMLANDIYEDYQEEVDAQYQALRRESGWVPVDNLRSFFADRERDAGGRCLPSGAGGVERASEAELKAAQKIARAKIRNVKPPTPEEIEDAQRRIAEQGSDKYRKATYGNSYDRKRSREKLLKEFGDGKTCPCVYCAVKLDDSTVTRDHIYTLQEGGKYRQDNLLPSCLSCNSSRQDIPIGRVKWLK